jgi:hypothetical protein
MFNLLIGKFNLVEYEPAAFSIIKEIGTLYTGKSLHRKWSTREKLSRSNTHKRMHFFVWESQEL